MILDLVSIAAFAAPIVAIGAEAFSKAAGEKLGGNIDRLSQAVINKLKGDAHAEQILSRAREMPDSPEQQNALKSILEVKMKEDPVFAEEMAKLEDEMQNDMASAHASFYQSGQTIGIQNNIGNVQGSVNIGTK